MPTNEFEKQVQDQLGDLRLNPSASVWEKVEEQIREKKRRRLIFFFLLPVAIGLLGISAYYFLNTGNKTETAQQAIAAEEKNTLPTDQKNISNEAIEQAANSNSLQQETVAGESTATEKIIAKQVPEAISKNNVELSANQPSAGQVKKKTTMKSNRSRLQTQKDNYFEIVSSAPEKQKTDIVADEHIAADKQSDPVVVIANADKKVQTEEAKIAAKETASVKTDTVNTESIVATDTKSETITVKKSGKPKIKWGIDLSGGMAFNNKGTLSFARAQAFDMNYVTPGNATSNPGNPSAIIPPSSVRSGPAFKAGITGELQVSQRSSFSMSLQYMYASNRTRTGVRSDTVVQLQSNNFSATRADVIYRGTQQNDYTNRYHFVTIPVTYHLQLNKGRKMPVQWNAGIALSYLVTTNALVYDAALGGIYYQNKDAFTKLHANIGTGLSVRLQTKSGKEWVIGPELSFDMSRLVKNDSKQYLLFGGINTKLIFSKKKKQ